MIFLFLNVVFASAFTLILKWVQVRKLEDVYTIGAVNYITAAIAVAPEFFQNPVSIYDPNAIWTGGSMGLCYFIAFFFVVVCIRLIGASASTVVSVLSILLPITLAAFIWDEVPGANQVFGIGLALVSLILIGARSKRKVDVSNTTNADTEFSKPKPVWLIPLVIGIFFLLCGYSRLAQDTFKHLCDSSQRPTYLFSAFIAAAIPSVILLVYRRKKIKLMELMLGAGLGLANILQTHFILKSLQYYEGFVVFPVTSAGGILLTTFIAVGLLGERINRAAWIGIGIAVVALFLLY